MSVWGWLAEWWTVLLFIAVMLFGAWAARARQRHIESFTDICPVCGGDGRVTKRSQP